MKKGDKLYYARILVQTGTYEVCDLTVRSVQHDWFSCVEKRTKNAFLFSTKDLGVLVYQNRNEALRLVKEAEKNKKKISTETYYEEY